MFDETIERTWTARLFAAPTSLEEAVSQCTDFGKALLAIATIQAVLLVLLAGVGRALGRPGFLLMLALPFAALTALLGFFVWRHNSTAAATLSLVFALVSLVYSIVALAMRGSLALHRTFLPLVIAWVAFRAHQGTHAVRYFTAAPNSGAKDNEAAV